ncbi:unnamed protein product [Moneuplotes crassus]|uniref:Uncharacterized protein n=1 Tax=Euplotes crassus TaxID=5936 RepID=A0AAD1XM58_EUPCR|nr:unnamed protein product [Moneuplotes crassus]
MKTTAIVIALGVLAASYFLVAPTADPLESEFQMYLGKYGKNYHNEEEYSFRLKVFKQNYQIIEESNRQGKSYTLGLNKFGDWTREEYKKLLTHNEAGKKQAKVADIKGDYEPDPIDHRELGAVNPVVNQGACGGCYAFSAAAVVEGMLFNFGKGLMKYSEQEIIDCSEAYGNARCNGGHFTQGFDFLHENLFCTDKEYPYTAGAEDECKYSTCDDLDHEITVREYFSVPENSALSLKESLTYNIIGAGVGADSEIFQFYKSGIVNDKACGNNNNHAITVVGHGIEDGVDYFIIRNSWGADWGEEGYIRLGTSFEEDKGVCGILQDLAFPMYRC